MPLSPNDVIMYREYRIHGIHAMPKRACIALPPESIRIEILVEVIHAPQRTLEESVLGPLLRKRGVIIKDDEIAYVLAYYDIKKNGL